LGECVILDPGNGVGLNYVSYFESTLNIEAYYIGSGICLLTLGTNVVDLDTVTVRGRLTECKHNGKVWVGGR
jgi:hypothetical protein